MSDLGLGKLITTEQERDAIHIAVAPVTAAEKLLPGERIGLADGKASANAAHIGIVDPYLQAPVFAGQRFWLFLFPNTVTSLRHHWTHPKFDAAEIKEASKPSRNISVLWLTEFAKNFDLSYDGLVDAARAFANYGDYTRLGFDTPDEAYTQRHEMWRHLEIAEGIKPESVDDTFFCCSC